MVAALLTLALLTAPPELPVPRGISSRDGVAPPCAVPPPVLLQGKPVRHTRGRVRESFADDDSDGERSWRWHRNASSPLAWSAAAAEARCPRYIHPPAAAARPPAVVPRITMLCTLLL